MKIRIEFDSISEGLRVSRNLIDELSYGKDMENITKLMEVTCRIVDALESGKLDVMVSDISIENFVDAIVIPNIDKCDCYHSGYCWGTKELDKCDCGGRNSRCTFYKKGF